MKPWLLLTGLLLARLGATAAPAAPFDTIAGHARLVGVFSESLCSKLQAASTRVEFQQLPSRQSDRMINRLFEEILLENRAEMHDFQQRIPRPVRAAYWQRVGREAVLRLLDTCPRATTWLIELNSQGLTDKNPVGEAERRVLLPAATDICARITAEHSLDERFKAAESRALVGQAFREVLLARAPELTAYYGESLGTDPAQLRNVAERLTLVMFGICPKYPLLLSMKQDSN